MNIRKTILIAATTLLVPMGGFLLAPRIVGARGMRGGRNLTPEQRETMKAERAAKMKEALGLSDAQATEIQAIKDSYESQFEALHVKKKALRENGSDREAMQPLREEMKTLRDQVKAEVATVLTAEQQAKFEEMKSERGGRHGGSHRGGRRGADANG